MIQHQPLSIATGENFDGTRARKRDVSPLVRSVFEGLHKFLVLGFVISTFAVSVSNLELGSTLLHSFNSSAGPKMTQDFVFAVQHFNSTRQSGKCLNLILKFRYKSVVSPSSGPAEDGYGPGGYIDYKPMRLMCLKYLQPTKDLPEFIQWEVVNWYMVKEIMEKFEVTGVSSQIQVMNDVDDPSLLEPSNHGSIVTIGDLVGSGELQEPWNNAFRFE